MKVLRDIGNHQDLFTVVNHNNPAAEHEFISPVTIEEIINTIKELKNKLPGLSKIKIKKQKS